MIRGQSFFNVVVFLTTFFSTSLLMAAPAIEVSSSPNPVGSGARALGMGGAFIGVADDATAASWNPGGLIQLDKPEVSMVFNYQGRSEDIGFKSLPDVSSDVYVDHSDLNYLSAAYPFVLARRNMIVSVNYQRLYDFNREWEFDVDLGGITLAPYHYEQKGDLYALGFAYSTMVTLDLSVGITVNYWGDLINRNQWTQTYNYVRKTPGLPDAVNLDEYTYEFEGWNANLGFLWRLSERWTLGGVLKMPFEADIDHKESNNGFIKTYKDTMDMPMSYGLGVAYRHSDKFTVSADIYRTHWQDFIYHHQDGTNSSPVSGKDESQSDIDATTWLRAGMEYLYIGRKLVVPIRAGIFYDPSPAEKNPDDYYGFTLGSGIAYKRWVWDIAYQFRYGDNVSGGMLDNIGFFQDVIEHTVYTSLIVHF